MKGVKRYKINCVVHLKVAKKVDLTSSYHKKCLLLWVLMVVNETCCDHLAIYTNIEPLCCTPEMNVMLYVSYISISKINILSRELEHYCLSHSIAAIVISTSLLKFGLKDFMMCSF